MGFQDLNDKIRIAAAKGGHGHVQAKNLEGLSKGELWRLPDPLVNGGPVGALRRRRRL